MILKIVNKSTKRNKEQRYFEEKEKKTNIELDKFLDHLESDNKFLEEKEI